MSSKEKPLIALGRIAYEALAASMRSGPFQDQATVGVKHY
jgi:hypothetical protein